MITDEDPLRGLLFYQDLVFSHTPHVIKERRRRCEHPHLRGKGSPVPAGPPIFDDADTMCACAVRNDACPHPGVELRANLKSISHSCHLFEVVFVWELTKETIDLPLGCLQGGMSFQSASHLQELIPTTKPSAPNIKPLPQILNTKPQPRS